MKQIPFRIAALKVEDFKLTDAKPQEEARIEVRISYEFGVNLDAHMVIARIKYKYVQAETELLQMTLTSSFDVKEADFLSLRKDNTITLEPYFTQYLCTINVGSARGEIHARCEQANSVLANVILPPINLVEALPDPIVIELHQ